MEYLVITRAWSLFDVNYHKEFMELVIADSKEEVIDIIDDKYNNGILDGGKEVIKIYELKKIYDLEETIDTLNKKLSNKSEKIHTTDITPMTPEQEEKELERIKKMFENEKKIESALSKDK